MAVGLMIVIAQCTDKKRSGEHPAKELYMASDLFKAQRRYAEAYADGWYILSAKHGLIKPNRVVSDYDVHIGEQADERWVEQVSDTVARISKHNDRVEVIAGEKYAERVVPWLEEHDIGYSKPFDGERYAVRIQHMTEEARREENFSLGDWP